MQMYHRMMRGLMQTMGISGHIMKETLIQRKKMAVVKRLEAAYPPEQKSWEKYFCENSKIGPECIFKDTQMPMKLDFIFAIAG